jgi:hypothetical protein
MPDTAGPRPVRFGGAEAVACVLLATLGVVLFADLGFASMVCMDSSSDNCALGVIGGHLPVFLVAFGVIALVWSLIRRHTGRPIRR